MNVVNKMVSDLGVRAGKKPLATKRKTISWYTSSIVILLLGISTLSFTIWSFEQQSTDDPMIQVAQFDKSSVKEDIPMMETLSKDSNFVPKSTDIKKPKITKIVDGQIPDKTGLKKTVEKKLFAAKNSSKISVLEKRENKINVAKDKQKMLISKKMIEKPKAENRKNIKKLAPPKKIIANKKTDRVKLDPVLTGKVVAAKNVVSKPNQDIPTKVASNQLRKKSIEFSLSQKAKKYYAEALAKLNDGNTALAKNLLQKALATKKKHISARKLLAGIYINQKELEKAKKLLIEGIKELPEASIFYHWLGRIYMEQGDFDQASVLLADGSKFAKKGDYFALMALAQQNTDGLDSAIESYRRALTIIPSKSKWWLGLGIVLEKIENWKEAEIAYKTALLSENLPFNLHKKTTGRLTFVKNQLALLDD